MNLGEQATTDGVVCVLQSEDDDAVDPHLECIRNEAGRDESDEEDEGFVADEDDGGSPTDDSGEEDAEASDSGDEKEKNGKKESKKDSSSTKPSVSKKKVKGGEEDSSKKRKQKKKDPNPPKKKMKKSNPGLSFGDASREIADKWREMSAEEKKPYVAKARADKKRYMDKLSGYKNPQPMNIDSD